MVKILEILSKLSVEYPTKILRSQLMKKKVSQKVTKKKMLLANKFQMFKCSDFESIVFSIIIEMKLELNQN